ncbi:hypothetical protein GCM10023210_44220 [Chryseobacterium ginsengisoli]|uniref:Bulb-type lectin domain-containing protein n=1 Tax=Chryseobacterium ginsengisoli TaxID=363853 RepID=A0ABP9MY29_9FLAO
MRFILSLFTILSLTQCSSDNSPKHSFILEGFIKTNGSYSWGKTQKNIVVKNIENSCKIFAITDKRGRILYQQPLNVTFSDYHYWLCYADDKDNLYYYNSDYNEVKALIWNSELKKYDEVNFCSTKINLPSKFKDELKKDATLTDCLSLK